MKASNTQTGDDRNALAEPRSSKRTAMVRRWSSVGAIPTISVFMIAPANWNFKVIRPRRAPHLRTDFPPHFHHFGLPSPFPARHR